MVKRQKEKQYQSAREQRDYGRSRAANGSSSNHNMGSVQKALPFACCALTLTPFENPVCTIMDDDSHHQPKYAVVFDNAALMEYVLKHQRDPVTGKALKSSQIIRLHMDQDTEGRWQCPILTKPFADHSKIVAVLVDNNNNKSKSTKNLAPSLPTEAYVYSYEAYQELNVKTKNWTDLTTGHKFHPKRDVLLLNDPNDPILQSKRDISSFWHTQHKRDTLAAAAAASGKASGTTNIKKSVTATRIMEQLEKNKQQQQIQEREASAKRKEMEQIPSSSMYAASKNQQQRSYKVLAKDVTGIELTEGKAAGSLTSTSMAVSHRNADREATPEELLQSYFRILKTTYKGEQGKGYVKLILRFDHHNASANATVELLLELHCDIAPRTCMNFLGLCRENHYDGTIFHRIIPGFMMQGGKAPADQKDTNYWGDTGFQDEFDDRLKHTEPGILSMANAGPNTNFQQFFVTFQACPHLDRKHSVFGQVVDGMDRILDQIGRIQTDKKDRPRGVDITIVKTEIITDPVQEVQDLEDGRLRRIAEERDSAGNSQNGKVAVGQGKGSTSGTSQYQSLSQDKNKVGKYLSSRSSVLEGFDTTATKNSENPKDDLPASGWNVHAFASKRASANQNSNPKKKPKFGDFSSW